jgi:multimeric flavodoxin WrbA
MDTAFLFSGERRLALQARRYAHTPQRPARGGIWQDIRFPSPPEAPVDTRALFLNCTLKPSPDVSNTQALIDKVAALMQRQGVTTETMRIADHGVGTGISSDLGDGDGWPPLLEKVRACDILVIGTPIWLGHMSSVCQRVIERLDDTYADYDPGNGQFPLYNKVGAVIVTGNEDGAQATSSEVLYALQSFGCTIPPNSDVYWVGDAGAGPSYIAAGAERHYYTNKCAAWMAYNTVWMARALRNDPCPTDLLALAAEQLELSDTPKVDPHEQDRIRRERQRQSGEGV